MSRYYFDVEGNGFLDVVTRIWCICAIDLDTRQAYSWGPHQLQEALEVLGKAELLVGHNIIRYDLPALLKVLGFVPKGRILDTLVLAQLRYPDIRTSDEELVRKGILAKKEKGKHRLEVWGKRIGIYKTDYQGGFDEWSQEMQDYCDQDVVTGVAIWDYLKVEQIDPRAVELEHQATRITFRMEQAGWPFDEVAAGKLYGTLVGRHHELETSLVAKFGSWQEVKRVFVPKVDNKKLGYKKGVEVTTYKTVTFNPGSRPHIIKKLLEAGWKPTEFTEKGQPKLDEEILEELDLPEAKDLIEYLLIQKRLGQLADGDKGWLKCVRDGMVHASYNTMGTKTSRCAHFDPNIAQVPKVGKPYGAECRALFKVPKGWKLIGADFEGLELRCLAHYMASFDGGVYANTVVNGDVHWTHVLAMGLTIGEKDKDSLLHKILRDHSKTFTYADLYGCGALKAGLIVYGIVLALRTAGLVAEGDALFAKFFGRAGKITDGILRKAGERLKKQFMSYFPARQKLQKRVVEAAEEKKWVKGLDGRQVPATSRHSALNMLLQSAGAILCKNWLVDSYHALLEAGYRWGWDGDFVIVGFIHDELQIAVREGLEQEIGEIVCQCARATGPKFGFKCRLDSGFVVGNNWKETH